MGSNNIINNVGLTSKIENKSKLVNKIGNPRSTTITKTNIRNKLKKEKKKNERTTQSFNEVRFNPLTG